MAVHFMNCSLGLSYKWYSKGFRIKPLSLVLSKLSSHAVNSVAVLCILSRNSLHSKLGAWYISQNKWDVITELFRNKTQNGTLQIITLYSHVICDHIICSCIGHTICTSIIATYKIYTHCNIIANNSCVS